MPACKGRVLNGFSGGCYLAGLPLWKKLIK